MKTKILLFTSILFFIISCSSSDDEQTNTNTQNCKISKISYGYFSGTRVYNTVYSNGNLTELISNIDKIIFTYDNNNFLIKKEFYDIGNAQVQFRTLFTSNPSGQIVEQKSWEFYNNNLLYTGKETFTYIGNKLSEIKNYALDDTTIQEKIIFEWTNDNPTKLKLYDANNILECENTISYDLSKENKFNSTFKYFAFQDIYDEDFNTFQFLGKNIVTSHTNLCSSDIDNYNYSFYSNGLTDQVNLNGNMLWKFEYSCQ